MSAQDVSAVEVASTDFTDGSTGITGGRTGEPRMTARRRKTVVRTSQLAIIVALLVAWEFIPKIPGINEHVAWLDPFFISSPSRVARQLGLLATGAEGSGVIWSPLVATVLTSLVGMVLAMITGTICGIAVSNWDMLERITRPFLVVLNAIPKVAIIPIIILLVHTTRAAAGVNAFIAVFFLTFYNAAEGSSSVPREMIHNAELLGASKVRIMLRVRSPFAMAWTMAALPNAIAFALTATVTAEIIAGGSGLGYQLMLAMNNSNASLLFAIVVVVSVIGVALVLGSTALRKAVLPWWESSQGV